MVTQPSFPRRGCRRTNWQARVVSTVDKRSGKTHFRVRVNVGNIKRSSLSSSISSNKTTTTTTTTTTKTTPSPLWQKNPPSKQEQLKKIDQNAYRHFENKMFDLKQQAHVDDQVVLVGSSSHHLPSRPASAGGASLFRRQRHHRRGRRLKKKKQHSRPSTAGARSSPTRRQRQRQRQRQTPPERPRTSPLRKSARSFFASTELHTVLQRYGWQYVNSDPLYLSEQRHNAFVPETFDLGTSSGRAHFVRAYMKTVSRKIARLYALHAAKCRMLHSDATIVQCIKSCWHEAFVDVAGTVIGLNSCPDIELLMARTISLKRQTGHFRVNGYTEALEKSTNKLKLEIFAVLEHLRYINPHENINMEYNSWVVVGDGNGNGDGNSIMKDLKRILTKGGGQCTARRSVERPLTLKIGTQFSMNIWAIVAVQQRNILLFVFDTPYVIGIRHSTPFFMTGVQFCAILLQDALLQQWPPPPPPPPPSHQSTASTTAAAAVDLFENQIWTQVCSSVKLALQCPTLQHFERAFCLFDFTFAIDANMMLWLIKCSSRPEIEIPHRSHLVSSLVSVAADEVSDQAGKTFPFPFRDDESSDGSCGTFTSSKQPEHSRSRDGRWREIARQTVPVANKIMKGFKVKGQVEIEVAWRSKLASVTIQKIVRGYLVRKGENC